MIARTSVTCPHCDAPVDVRVVILADGTARVEYVGDAL